MLIEVTCKIEFEPQHFTRKHKSQASWKRVAMFRTQCDMHLYYAWFLRKRFNLELNKPLRGSHVTFINEIVDFNIFEEAKTLFNDREAKFYIDPCPRTNGEHWWLRAYSPDSDSIRLSMGLPKDPYFGLHFTIGHANEKNIAHSEYILEQCKFYNIIEHTPRLPFDDEVKMNFNPFPHIL